MIRLIGMCVLVLVCVGLLISGCDVYSTNEGGNADDPVVDPQCDIVTVSTSVEDNTSEPGWYWLGLVDRDTLVAGGYGYYFDSTCEESLLSIHVSEYMGIPDGEYELKAFRCDSLESLGEMKERTEIAAAGWVSVETQRSAEKEDQICCTRPATPSGTVGSRGYVGLKATRDDLVGVRAEIETRYGSLCGFPDTTNQSASAAWVGASGQWLGPQSKITINAQSGYGWERGFNPGVFGTALNEIWKFVYIETWGFKHQLVQYYYDWQDTLQDAFDPPVDGEFKEYGCELDPNDFTWHFYTNSVFLLDTALQDSVWKEAIPHRIDCLGEVYFYENDMPGSISDSCTFRDIQYRTLGGAFFPLDQHSVNDSILNDPINIWGVERLSYNEIAIWDRDTLE